MTRHDASAQFTTGTRRDLRNRLSLIRLPAIPQVLVRLLELCRSDTVSLSEMAALLGRDVTMTSRLMSVAASASYYGRQQPANLEQCLITLGTNRVKAIVITESVFHVFRQLGHERHVDLGRFWAHSLLCALLARSLAQAGRLASPEEAYLGGLLHDIGKLLLLSIDNDAYLPLFLSSLSDEALCQQELQLFDLTHAEAGAWLIEKWSLDSLLADSVLYHHEAPERLTDAPALIRLVHFVNRLVCLTLNAPGSLPVLQDDGLFDKSIDLHEILQQCTKEMSETAAQFGIAIELPEVTPPADSNPAAAPEEALADCLRDTLLLDTLLDQGSGSKAREKVLQHLIQASIILFNIQPALLFTPQDTPPGHYVAQPLGRLPPHVARLNFTVGQGNTAIANSLEQGVRLLSATDSLPGLLDAQLQRLIGKYGLLYLPLRDGSRCHGVMVAGLENEAHFNELLRRLSCLRQFAVLSARLLTEQASAADHSADDLRAHLRRVVHETSTPLAVIDNYLAILEQKFTEKEINTRELGIVSGEIGRVNRILRQAITGQISTSGVSMPINVDVNTLINEMLSLHLPLAATHDSRIEIRRELYSELPEIHADSDRLRQLLGNLLGNAADALSTSGGIVRVSTRLWNNGCAPSHVEICIEDSGPGLPEAVLDKLYQPVVSSKGAAHLGLGLAIVGQLVKELGGLINCRSSEQGTCYQILLPQSCAE